MIVLCRTCRHLCAGLSEGVVLTSEFDFPPTVPFFLSVFCHHCVMIVCYRQFYIPVCYVCHTCVGVGPPVHSFVRSFVRSFIQFCSIVGLVMHPLPIVLCLVAVVMVPAVIDAVTADAKNADAKNADARNAEAMEPPLAPPELRQAENSAKRGKYWNVARV